MHKVSVVIPTFNRQDTLLRAVKSALQQTYPVHEVLVCDDGSEDGSEKLISGLADTRVKWISCGKNGRPAVPRNKGITQASGDWIAFLDSDDEWLPEKIEKQLTSADGSYEAICCNALRIENGRNTGPYASYAKSVIAFADLLYGNPVICSSVLIKKKLLQDLSLFPEEPEFRAIEDYELWLRIATRFPFLYIYEPLLNYTDSPATSIRGTEADIWKQKEIIFSGLTAWMKERSIKLDPLSQKALDLAREHTAGRGKLSIPTRIDLKVNTILKNLLDKKEEPDASDSQPAFTSGSMPFVSVILPVYNAEKYIGEAMRSMLDQTYKNIELIVINDGSKDHSEEEIKKIQDPRIKYYSQPNAGMAATLNRGLMLAKGELIARQDADDISLPDRIQKQVDFFRLHPHHALTGTWATIIDDKGKPTGKHHKHPTGYEELKFDLLFDNMFVHSSVMFRKSVVETCGLYDEKLHPLVQDFEYWFRISRQHKVANLPECLQLYRQITSGISSGTANFSETVAGQSARHLATVWNAPAEVIGQFALDYHTCRDEARVARAEKILRKLAEEQLPGEFSGKEKIIARHVFTMRRNLYNQKLARSAGLDRFIYKVKRKLLFVKYREA